MYSSIIPYELAKLFGGRSDLWIPADMNYATKWHFDNPEVKAWLKRQRKMEVK